MTPARRLAATRAQLDQPPPTTSPGQTAIPLAALAVIEAAEHDASALAEDDHARTARISHELTRGGWTITPAR